MKEKKISKKNIISILAIVMAFIVAVKYGIEGNICSALLWGLAALLYAIKAIRDIIRERK